MEDSHAMGEGDEVSMDHNALRIGSSKGSNVREERGKAKRKEFTPFVDANQLKKFGNYLK